ncbi:MAG: UDP-N-acetylmuramoyl-tripeptide--D-alanyl-D-alanine ligase [Acidimicrobiia bacterium]|nr:UDP-N-acetylmuramoyl-tripeptide--D-alanyl-D-alanine ligase [Acidimicrobiia bacterium]
MATTQRLAEITGGVAYGEVAIAGISTDSRSLDPGALFVALRGETFDGHDYLAAALEAGAAAILVDTPAPFEPRIEVKDTLLALRAIAADHRSSLTTARVVGITGSTGKTSCKDLLASALGVGTWASPRSFNNEVGVPLTVLSAPMDTEILVLEVGSRGVGHISNLIEVVRPDIAVITGIGASHLATLGDVETVRHAKWELVEGLSPGGMAILPAEDRTLAEWAERDGVAVQSFGEGGDVRIEGLVLDEMARPSFVLEAGGERVGLKLSMAGAHQARNAAAAAAAGLALGRALPDLAAGLELAHGSAWRMEVTPGPFTVVNDAYNANPDSMAAALQSVAAMPGRHVAVLGLMAELGEAAPAAHRSVGRLARQLGYAAVVVVGEDPGIAEGAGDIVRAVPDARAAQRLITELVGEGDVVLVKASRSVGLEGLAGELVS